MYKGKIYLITTLLFSLLAGCGIYKFNATSISPDVKTISIYTIENRAMKVNPSLSNQRRCRISLENLQNWMP